MHTNNIISIFDLRQFVDSCLRSKTATLAARDCKLRPLQAWWHAGSHTFEFTGNSKYITEQSNQLTRVYVIRHFHHQLLLYLLLRYILTCKCKFSLCQFATAGFKFCLMMLFQLTKLLLKCSTNSTIHVITLFSY